MPSIQVMESQAVCVSVAVLLVLIVKSKVTTESQPAVLVKVKVAMLLIHKFQKLDLTWLRCPYRKDWKQQIIITGKKHWNTFKSLLNLIPCLPGPGQIMAQRF